MHLCQMIWRAEQQRARAIATTFMGRDRSWAETARDVRRLASALRALGVSCNEQVAILALNSDRYFDALFAVPQIGARIVPLNIRWAVMELSYALRDSQSRWLLFDRTFLPTVDALRAQGSDLGGCLFIGDADECPHWALPLERLIAEAAECHEQVQGEQQIAGIFYTGGTTGFPKGVMLTHAALLSSALSVVAAIEADEHSAVLHAAPMFHLADLAVLYTFTLLAARHVIVPAFEPRRVQQVIADTRLTDALLVPTMMQMLFDHPDFDAGKLAGLRRILYGASPMPEGLLRRVFATTPHIRLMQAYGQTEMAPVVSLLLPDDHVGQGERSRLLRSAGRAAYGVHIRIAGPEGATLAAGEIGEVCASGPNAMLGYWNKPRQTAEVLRDGWVHTGDVGYLDADGYLFLVDRAKDMIVSGGENVYSTEVESALSTHPAVGQVAVIGVPDPEWGEMVHAIVVARPGQPVDEATLIAHCRGRIAGYKCPRSVEFRNEALPLSGAGKILKRELRAPYWEGRDRQVN